MRPFVHLHVHTQYSLLCGAIRLKDLFSRVGELEMSAVAITDRNNMFGAVDFQLKAKKAKIHPIFGAQLSFSTDLTRGGKAYHLIGLATNAEGYKSLRHLSSDAYLKGLKDDKPHVDWAMLESHHGGLIVLSGGVYGIVERHLIEQGEAIAEEWALKFDALYGRGQFFLEVQPLKTDRQDRINAFFLSLNQRHGIPLVATNESFYLDQEEARAYKVLTCIAEGVTLREYEDEFTVCDQHWLKDGDRVAQELGPLFSDAVDQTVEIAKRCQFKIPLGDVFLPTYEVPEGFDIESFLRHCSHKGLEARFSEFDLVEKGYDEAEYRARLDRELGIIISMKFPGYFLIVQDFINWAKNKKIPVGPGRGSGAGSLVAYALKITDLDPIPYGLLFERFLNPDRVSMPDFDIDFCMNRRLEVIEYVTQKYGKMNVGQIATFGALKAKGVIKDVGRVLGFHYNDTDRLSKLIPDVLNITLDEALKQEPRLAKFYDEDRQTRDLIEIARSLEGLHRNIGMHAAGVVIGDEPLWNYCPMFRGVNGELVTQFAKDEVEMVGLVKFDFLGLKTLTVIQDAVELVNRARSGEPLDVYVLPLTDRGVYRLISSGETEGVFQLESSGFQDLLKKLKPDVFEDIVAAVALYRPGPLNSGMLDTFIDRKHGREEILYPHPLLEEILRETYGVIVYQEQVMQIAQVMADFTLGSADLLRRAMGKKKMDVMAQQRELFADGASNKGVSRAKADEIFDLMELFAQYGFNKSHSAAYALLTYHTAYLKAHHPAEFIAAVLSNDSDNAEKVAKGVRNAQRMKLKVLPPCVNRSLSAFNGAGQEILFGLSGVKGVGSSAVDSIIETREEGGPFSSLKNFCDRVNLHKVNKRLVENLIQVGAFDFSGEPRRLQCAALDTFIMRAQKKQKDEAAGQDNLFDLLSKSADESASTFDEDPLENWRDIGEWNQKQLLDFEKLSLGFYVSGHPLDRFSDLIRSLSFTPICDIPQCDRFQAVILIGQVASMRSIPSRNGGRVAFITFEDHTGAIEVIASGATLDLYEPVLGSGEPIMIMGEVKRPRNEGDNFKVDVGRRGEDPKVTPFVQTLNDLQGMQTRAIEVTFSGEEVSTSPLRKLKSLVKRIQYQGRCPLILNVLTQEGAQVYIHTPITLHPDEELAHEIRQCIQGAQVKFLGRRAAQRLLKG